MSETCRAPGMPSALHAGGRSAGFSCCCWLRQMRVCHAGLMRETPTASQSRCHRRSLAWLGPCWTRRLASTQASCHPMPPARLSECIILLTA